jgi:ubiquinone/menaquinone biosynthesis C-methylase UbiE
MAYLESTKEFYKKLKTEGMSKLMTKKRDSDSLKFLKSHLSKNQKILDLACGYGRLTIPLAKAGYKIEGIDLTPNFIRDAKVQAKENNLKLNFKIGNMLDLPYKNESFDAIICMWSSFNHILTQKDQVKSLNEMFRILKKEGIAIIDVPSSKKPTTKQIKLKQFFGKDNRLCRSEIDGFSFVGFIHDKNSLLRVLGKSKIKNSQVKIELIGGRKRLILYIYK